MSIWDLNMNVVVLKILTQWYVNTILCWYYTSIISAYYGLYIDINPIIKIYENLRKYYQILSSEDMQLGYRRILIKLSLIWYMLCENNSDRDSYYTNSKFFFHRFDTQG